MSLNNEHCCFCIHIMDICKKKIKLLNVLLWITMHYITIFVNNYYWNLRFEDNMRFLLLFQRLLLFYFKFWIIWFIFYFNNFFNVTFKFFIFYNRNCPLCLPMVIEKKVMKKTIIYYYGKYTFELMWSLHMQFIINLVIVL